MYWILYSTNTVQHILIFQLVLLGLVKESLAWVNGSTETDALYIVNTGNKRNPG